MTVVATADLAILGTPAPAERGVRQREEQVLAQVVSAQASVEIKQDGLGHR
jgi:hypothetical protein